MKPCVIGIAGRHQAGKDTVALQLQDAFRIHNVRHAIYVCGVADGMKEDIAECFSTDVAAINRAKLTTLGRKILEYVGNTIYDRSDFLDHIAGIITEAQRSNAIHIITGIRRVEEAAIIRRNGGWVLHVKRPLHDKIPRLPTEEEIDDIVADTIIENSGTIHDLLHLTHAIAAHIVCSYQLAPKV